MKQLTWRRLREATAVASAPALLREDAADGDPGEGESAGDVSVSTCTTCKGTGIKADGSLCSRCNGAGMLKSGIGGGAIDGVTESTRGSYWVYTDDPELQVLSMREASRTFSADVRKKYAKTGTAMSDGSYPIPDVDALHRAVSSYGHNPTAAVKEHIVKRARALNATNVLPADWDGSTQKSKESKDNFGGKQAPPFGKDGKSSDDDDEDDKNKDSKTKDKKSKESESSLLERVGRLEKVTSVFKALREAKPASMAVAFSQPTRVETSNGHEGYKVVLIREGTGNSEDNQWYTAECIKELCESGVCEGMQAYGNHPDAIEEENRPERDVKELVGAYHDVKYVEESGKKYAEGIFVPLTLDERHPRYGWVVTLAEAAVRSNAPQPLCGISLYGLSAGEDCDRPDGSYGRMVSMIRPSSADIVTNAGAGGGFIRQLMESARARMNRSSKELDPMQAAAYQQKYRDAAKRVREAATDEDRESALKDLEALNTESVDAAPDSIQALREAAPKLIDELTTQVKEEASKDTDELKAENGRLRETLSQITNAVDVNDALTAAEVIDPIERRHFAGKVREQGLSKAEDIKAMVENERAYETQQEEKRLTKLRESMNLDDLEVVGAIGRIPVPSSGESNDGGIDVMREVGIPLKDAQE